jgi:hypothetical protein
MKLETQLFEKCKDMNYNCSITYQRINDYSVEIYTGYKSNYQLIFYSDGHSSSTDATKKGIKFLNKQ